MKLIELALYITMFFLGTVSNVYIHEELAFCLRRSSLEMTKYSYTIKHLLDTPIVWRPSANSGIGSYTFLNGPFRIGMSHMGC